MAKTRVYLEVGAKRTFASAADWPGWSRAGKTEQAALEALAAYAPRYGKAAKLAGVPFVAGAEFEVVEKVKGNATTDFGAPGVPTKDEARTLTPKDVQRLSDLLAAGWTYLDGVVAKAPEELRKGPRGGGRDRDKMFDHVVGAETEYAKGIGVRLKPPDGRDKSEVKAFRKAMLEGLGASKPGARWPVAYFVRRTAWHALDHAWEIEDRSEP